MDKDGTEILSLPQKLRNGHSTKSFLTTTSTIRVEMKPKWESGAILFKCHPRISTSLKTLNQWPLMIDYLQQTVNSSSSSSTTSTFSQTWIRTALCPTITHRSPLSTNQVTRLPTFAWEGSTAPHRMEHLGLITKSTWIMLSRRNGKLHSKPLLVISVTNQLTQLKVASIARSSYKRTIGQYRDHYLQKIDEIQS